MQQGYLHEATETLHKIWGGRLPKDRIFINVVHVLDDARNFDGGPKTNAEIAAAVGAAQQSAAHRGAQAARCH